VETIKKEIPIHEVEENSIVTLTVDTNAPTLILLKDNKELKPSERIEIVRTSSTTTEIRIVKAKPDDEGKYTVIVDNKEQPLVQLKVIPKPVTQQTMDLPQTTFSEGDTLTINCQFDSVPDESFEFLRNGQPLITDDRITTTVQDTTYTIVVKGLRPNEDEGVYTLKSKHLILDTPSITVVSKPKQPETTVTEEEISVEETKSETVRKTNIEIHMMGMNRVLPLLFFFCFLASDR